LSKVFHFRYICQWFFILGTFVKGYSFQVHLSKGFHFRYICQRFSILGKFVNYSIHSACPVCIKFDIHVNVFRKKDCSHFITKISQFFCRIFLLTFKCCYKDAHLTRPQSTIFSPVEGQCFILVSVTRRSL